MFQCRKRQCYTRDICTKALMLTVMSASFNAASGNAIRATSKGWMGCAKAPGFNAASGNAIRATLGILIKQQVVRSFNAASGNAIRATTKDILFGQES